MCLSDQFCAFAGRRTRGRNNPHVTGIEAAALWINRTGRFSPKACDSSREARAHRASRKGDDTWAVQASFTPATTKTATDTRQPTSQIRTGHGSGTITAGAVVAPVKESADPIGLECCCSVGVNILVIGAVRLECNEE